jgi:predicted NUDIX family phosphoesterase
MTLNIKNLKHSENILVVSRQKIFSDQEFNGLAKKNINNYLDIIKKNMEFKPRYLMEEDLSFKQVIPYIIFQANNKIFVMQRQNNASEQRLKNKFSIGIGGHIRITDVSSDSILDWAKREFHEEVNFNDDFDANIIGLVNDDSTFVGKVHLGVVILMVSQSENIKIRSELKSGQLVDIKDLHKYINEMENWSQIIIKEIWPKPL